MGNMKGLVYYENIESFNRTGIINSHRPVVIVSAAPTGNLVQVVPLTTKNNKLDENDARVQVKVKNMTSYALCAQIRTVNYRELSSFPMWVLTDKETEDINCAVRRVLAV